MDNHTETPGCADGGRGHYDPCTCRPTNEALVAAFENAVVMDERYDGLGGDDLEGAKAAILARLSSMGDLEAQVEALRGALPVLDPQGMRLGNFWISWGALANKTPDFTNSINPWRNKVAAIPLLSPNPKSEVTK